MKFLLATLLLSSTAFAEPVFLNIPSEHNGSPAMTIPTASHQECEKLMVKLSKEQETNFYLSCSIEPMTAAK